MRKYVQNAKKRVRIKYASTNAERGKYVQNTSEYIPAQLLPLRAPRAVGCSLARLLSGRLTGLSVWDVVLCRIAIERIGANNSPIICRGLAELCE